MDKKPWKRGKETYRRIHKLIYMTSCKQDKGEKEQNQERKIRRKEERGERLSKEGIFSGNLPFFIDVKGGEKVHKNKDRGKNGHKGSVSLSINVKGGDCWKIGFH
jgi:hypothetical protein